MTIGCRALISKLTEPPIVGSWGPTQGSSCPLLMPQGWGHTKSETPHPTPPVPQPLPKKLGPGTLTPKHKAPTGYQCRLSGPQGTQIQVQEKQGRGRHGGAGGPELRSKVPGALSCVRRAALPAETQPEASSVHGVESEGAWGRWAGASCPPGIGTWLSLPWALTSGPDPRSLSRMRTGCLWGWPPPTRPTR